jgi:hypothetical protein
MFGDGSLTFREFATREPYPLAMVHDAVLDFMRGRDDVVLCGSQAINAYIDDARMTQDVDILSTRAADLALEVRDFLSQQFEMRLRTGPARVGSGFRIYQVRQPKNRHLVDVRSVSQLPPCQHVQGVRVIMPSELIASKVLCMLNRRGPKKHIDMADLFRMLLAFPELKVERGQVAECLRAIRTSHAVMTAWKDLVAREILPEGEDDKFLW